MESSCFTGKRALVTGGNRGIGLGIARALYKKGAHVIIAGRNQALLDEVVKEMPNIEAVCVDVSDWKATEEAILKILPIQLLVNNAGVDVMKPFGQFSEDDFSAIYNTNARKMPGSIVNMSSVAGLRPVYHHSVYGSSKAAVDSLTTCMAYELGRCQIRVNSVNPTVVMTDLGKELWSDPAKSDLLVKRTPLGRLAEVSDVVNAVMFLLSDESSYLTGTILPVDGGVSRV